MAYHIENFVPIRTFAPTYFAWRPAGTRYASAEPSGAVELDYRDLLVAANQAYFHREYAVALRLYLELRQKILVQSHPELPATPGILDDLVLDVDSIDFTRLVELGRRHLTQVAPGEPISLPAADRRLFAANEVEPNSTLAAYRTLGVDPGFADKSAVDVLRLQARRQVTDGDSTSAQRIYARQVKIALSEGDIRLAADTIAESGAVLATYDKDSGAAREKAAAAFGEAADYYRILGDVQAAESMASNLRTLQAPTVEAARRIDGPLKIPAPITDEVFLVPSDGAITSSAALVAGSAKVLDEARSVGLSTPEGTSLVALDQTAWQAATTGLFEQRLTATTLKALAGWDLVPTTFVAYLPHLFFSVLPIAIGDTYRALGQYSQAVAHYTGVLKYPYLNVAIEGTDLWMRLAGTQLAW
ncbi:MAG: hypothetical protein ACRCYU_03915, partial [Nocardioides sp.]